ncbi:MAG: hypothetical protein R3D67_10340 [Hyphomicrobiaceae bacterium]
MPGSKIVLMQCRSVALAAVLAVLGGAAAMAQDAKSTDVTVPPIRKIELTPEETAEREARKACKVAICAAFHNRKPVTGDVTCSVLKSWRKEQLTEMVSKAKVSWPWGPVKCTADIKLSRDMLMKALTEPKYDMKLENHKVACEVERPKAEKANLSFIIAPKVTFEKGKAVKAHLGWGKIEAPTLVKGAMWTATATDNTFNVLQSMIVKDINEFIGPKCDEVKSEWNRQ